MSAPDWRHLPSLSALRAFEVAARHRNFSAAARPLNVTHAAIGQAARSLEAELGTALLRRNGRDLALTEDGERPTPGRRDSFAVQRGHPGIGHSPVRLGRGSRTDFGSPSLTWFMRELHARGVVDFLGLGGTPIAVGLPSQPQRGGPAVDLLSHDAAHHLLGHERQLRLVA